MTKNQVNDTGPLGLLFINLVDRLT